MFYDSEVVIENIGDYIKEIMRLRNLDDSGGEFFQWYRGHADKSWDLVPKVQRGFVGDVEELCRIERYYTNDFQARASLFKSQKPKLDEYSNWLTIMQHYGLPTRLLDWSRSPLVALYFAVSETIDSQSDACVWILTPGRLNKSENLEKPTIIARKKYENVFIYNMAHKTIATMVFTAFRRWKLSSNRRAITPEDRKFNHRIKALNNKIAACYPTESDGRIYNQHAAFTVHNSMRKLVDICDECTLMRITIPNNKKRNLLYELSVCGITESYIYPDLEHLADELQQMYGK